jgi:hypothetical protein
LHGVSLIFVAAVIAATFPAMDRARAATQAAALPCEPADALATEITGPDEDGVIRLKEGFRIRLANIVWPDPLQPRLRESLRATLSNALAGQKISWKPAAGPDRWGVTPAHLFVKEASGDLPPFWLQAGLAETGLVPAWPDPAGACMDRIAEHEASAIRARRGIWAPRAQAERHRVIQSNPAMHAGRRIVALWRVRSVKPWRSMHFVNIVPSFRGGPSIGLTRKQVTALNAAGKKPADWKGKWILARFVLGPAGLSRIRVETINPVNASSRRP